jgi:hypothetical protein
MSGRSRRWQWPPRPMHAGARCCSPRGARRWRGRAGDRAASEAVCLQAAELARGLADGELFARAALALGAEVSAGRVDAPLIHLLQEALTRLPEGDDDARARVLARLAAARQPDLDPEAPMALARAAIAIARRTGPPEVLLEVIGSAMGALVDYAPPAERAALNEEAIGLAARLGDRPRGLRARQRRLVFDRLDLGDLLGFERALAEYEAVAEQTGQTRYQWASRMFRSMRANWQGRFEDADRLAQEARALREVSGAADRRQESIRCLLDRVLRWRSDPATAERIDRSAFEAADLALFDAMDALLGGRESDAQTWLEQLERAFLEPLERDRRSTGASPT